MIQLESWSDRAEAMLMRASSDAVLPLIQDEVNRGISQLWHGVDEYADCYLVTRLEYRPMEIVCIVAAGRGATHYARMLIAECKRRGWRMRCHVDTDNKATARLWQRLGFKPQEIIMRIEPDVGAAR